MPEPKVYLAAPFFNKEQVQLVQDLEHVINQSGWRMFSPRKGENALEMNRMIQAYQEWRSFENAESERPAPPQPSAALRLCVFNDNWMNIDDADLMLAVIDNFDVGVMWEVGYAYARQVPIVTYTNKDYGCNLMLAHSIVGHLKDLRSAEDVLEIGNPALSMHSSVAEYGEAIAMIQSKYKTLMALKEGPGERAQS